MSDSDSSDDGANSYRMLVATLSGSKRKLEDDISQSENEEQEDEGEDLEEIDEGDLEGMNDDADVYAEGDEGEYNDEGDELQGGEVQEEEEQEEEEEEEDEDTGITDFNDSYFKKFHGELSKTFLSASSSANFPSKVFKKVDFGLKEHTFADEFAALPLPALDELKDDLANAHVKTRLVPQWMDHLRKQGKKSKKAKGTIYDDDDDCEEDGDENDSNDDDNNDGNRGTNGKARASSSSSSTCFSSPVQQKLFALFNSYHDVWFANRTPSNAQMLNGAYLLHVTNHVLKTRDLILKNNSKVSALLKRQKEQQEERKMAEREAAIKDRANGGGGKRRKKKGLKRAPLSVEEAAAVAETELQVQDQGFTRPKVLMLLPTRHAAYTAVTTMLNLLPDRQKMQVLKKKKFVDEFGSPQGVSADPTKPEDYRAAFAGNSDDCFRMGLSLTRKSVKLFTDFYDSDVLVASPLGLRMVVGTKGDKDRDYDFLSSIDILVMDSAEMFSMQNWDHIKVIMEVLNSKPYKLNETDFSRIRPYFLDGFAPYYRQTLVFSGYCSPDLTALFNRHCQNSTGRVKIRTQYPGSLSKVVPSVKQIFTRVQCSSLLESADQRLAYFMENIFPKIKASTDGHTLIFIPSYFDYVRLRNAFKKANIHMALACEYTRPSELSRCRSDFFHGKRKFMLLTERFHFYRRYKIRGIQSIVFYGLPEHPDFYHELLNFIENITGDNTVLALFTKYDALALERVVGSARAQKLLTGTNKVHMFC